jgi:putative membrane protein
LPGSAVYIHPSNENNMEDTALRDRLALERTRLANERTLLGYIRTALALLAAAAAVFHFLPGYPAVLLTAWLLAVIGIATLAIGAIRFVDVQRRLSAQS